MEIIRAAMRKYWKDIFSLSPLAILVVIGIGIYFLVRWITGDAEIQEWFHKGVSDMEIIDVFFVGVLIRLITR